MDKKTEKELKQAIKDNPFPEKITPHDQKPIIKTVKQETTYTAQMLESQVFKMYGQNLLPIDEMINWLTEMKSAEVVDVDVQFDWDADDQDRTITIKALKSIPYTQTIAEATVRIDLKYDKDIRDTIETKRKSMRDVDYWQKQLNRYNQTDVERVHGEIKKDAELIGRRELK